MTLGKTAAQSAASVEREFTKFAFRLGLSFVMHPSALQPYKVERTLTPAEAGAN